MYVDIYKNTRIQITRMLFYSNIHEMKSVEVEKGNEMRR